MESIKLTDEQTKIQHKANIRSLYIGLLIFLGILLISVDKYGGVFLGFFSGFTIGVLLLILQMIIYKLPFISSEPPYKPQYSYPSNLTDSSNPASPTYAGIKD